MSNRILEGFNESLPEKVAKYILEEIFAGNLKQGDRLVESNIATKFKVSHAPIREALYILEKQGVVERIPRKGVRIRIIDDKEIRDYLEALAGIIRLSSKVIKNWSQEKYEQLEEIYRAAETDLQNGNIRDYVQTVSCFLTIYVSNTNNPVYQRFTSEILFITKVFAQLNWNQDLVKNYHAQLTSSLEAIKERDFELAGERLSRTIWISIEGHAKSTKRH
ncbi:GntR family transcriptional regulator [Paenibacillus lentus]|uniref:GntR family transcriptional regulator n=1 Tax=Paenibacillus lentus TaxID=1338368 RepID=A0A3S8RRZ5_9BACL|nr:GntR family transcriptional regulator [Paenibacillus lentus]AZK45669.1 GntR family transcriptional regulator [Paenibacillus lentus]